MLNITYFRVERYNKFFGPGIVAQVNKIDSANRIVDLKLTTTSKGIKPTLVSKQVENIAQDTNINTSDNNVSDFE